MSRRNPTTGGVLILIGLGLSLPPHSAAQGPGGRGGAAWPDVFVSLGMYTLTFEKPVVDKGDMPKVYQQKATYTWSGGRFEIIHVTLARDPAFKDKFSADVLKKEKNPPREVEINKKKAWLWDFAAERPKFNEASHRLVILLDVDKAIIIDHIGMGPGPEMVAKRFDFARIDKALANPPAK